MHIVYKPSIKWYGLSSGEPPDRAPIQAWDLETADFPCLADVRKRPQQCLLLCACHITASVEGEAHTAACDVHVEGETRTSYLEHHPQSPETQRQHLKPTSASWGVGQGREWGDPQGRRQSRETVSHCLGDHASNWSQELAEARQCSRDIVEGKLKLRQEKS